MDEFREVYLKDIQGKSSAALAGRRIVLAITGSVAAMECPRLARTLMRHGADVWVCMTRGAAKLVTPTMLGWCSGNPVITEISGWVEHLFLAGDWKGAADLVLVAPATANSVGKMAHGIDDTVVTTVAATALGAGVPLVVAPGMHACMARHPAFMDNVDRLRALGASIVEPHWVEGKAKMAAVEAIVTAVIARLGRRDLQGRRVLITAGPTVEYLDDVRVITNLSSGKMGVALAAAATLRGAQVTLVYGPASAPPPSGVELVRAVTTADMLEAVRALMQKSAFDVAVFAAAVCDFTPRQREPAKVATRQRERWSVDLVPTPKIVQAARAWTDGLVVAFKAEATESDTALLQRAREQLESSGADVTVANRVGAGRGFLEDDNEVYVVGRSGEAIHVPLASKRVVADRIWDAVVERLKPPRRDIARESTPAASPVADSGP